MIIVSQDKTEVINFNNIVRLSVDVNVNGKFLIEAHNFCDDFETVIGFYETEERAKEVLNEIVNTRAIIEIYKCSDYNTQDMFDKKMLEENLIFDTYEMPEI